MKHIFLLILLHVLCISWLNAEPLVQVSQGILNGTIEQTRNGRKYSAFRGIPYAQPPIGDLRFKSPEPAKKWNGIRQATAFGSGCPQDENGTIIGNEDCLFLNVFTPLLKFDVSSTHVKKSHCLLPVMVFIHGGGYFEGDTKLYSGEFLLDKDIILVTMNYRLGILGYFSTGDSESPGNYGMKDQVLSLKWVKENIKSFGGNPNKVTLFGESSGGACVGLHALSRASNGLFQQYILQSGNPLTTWAYRKRNDFVQYKKKVASLLSCSSESSKNLVSCLKTKSVNSLLNISSSIQELADPNKFWWKPTDEDEAEDAFLTNSPLNLMNQNQWKDLPFISGGNTDEGAGTTEFFLAVPSFYNFVKTHLNEYIVYVAQGYLNAQNKEKFVTEVKNFYFNNSVESLGKDEFIEKLVSFVDNGYYHYSQIRTLEKQASRMRNPIYFYLFSYRGENSLYPDIEKYRKKGAGHAEELIYLFNFPLIFGPLTSDSDKFISNLMVELWTSFAMNGKPTSKSLQTPNLWVPYDAEKTLHLQIGNLNNFTDPAVTLSNTYYNGQMKFWKKNAPI